MGLYLFYICSIHRFGKIAPKTVHNFRLLCTGEKGLGKSGKPLYYKGTPFHRIIPHFMIQGGDPEGTGMGGSPTKIPGEFASNGFKNDLKHTRGVLSMARSMMPNSASSQFFIMVEDSPHLNGEYAAFGMVLEGMETADDIVWTPRDSRDKPLQEQKMKSIRVETV